MFQKLCHWVKNRAERRPLWMSAALVALLVHLLLLGLFRYVPQSRSKNAGNLAAISTVDLNARENQELMRWVEFHDPALMTAPDTPYGYSHAVLDMPFRPPAADLPRPAELARPKPGIAPEVERSNWRQLEAFPVLGSVTPTAKARKKSGAGVQVFRNGNSEAALSQKLNEKYRNLKQKSTPKQATEIAALPRAGRFRLAQSSGDAELDRMALYELTLYSRSAKIEADDIYSVNWRNAPNTGEAKP